MKRSIAKGTPEQFLNLVQNKIAELGGDVEACDKIQASDIDKVRNPAGIHSFVISKLSSVGVDVHSPEAEEYADAAVDLIYFDPHMDVNTWWRETQQNYMDEVNSLPHVESCDNITASSDTQGWWTKYYDVVDGKTLADALGCEVDDISPDKYDGYDFDHLGYLMVKEEYVDQLESYDGLDLVREGGQVFPAMCSHGRMYDVSDEIKECVEDADIESCDKITSARDNDSTYDDRFIHNLMGYIESEVCGEVDGLTFDTLENSLSVTVVHGGEVTQFTVPHDELSFDFDTLSDDVDYIVKTIRETLDSDSFSSDDEVADIDTELSDIGSATNTCGIACKPEVLSSVNGDVIHGLTWAGLIQELSERGYEVDSAYRRSPDQWIVAYKDGKSYDIEVTRYSEGDYEVHPDNISEVIEADTDVYENDDINDDVLVGFSEIASKSVPDSDGLSTDYTMYLDTNTGEYVFVFGDKAVYSPADGDFDWQCETEEEAWEWFNSYNGFADDEEDLEDEFGEW